MLTIADGVLTIELLDTNSEEMNPIMAHLLLQGYQAFLLGKYILTAAGLPFIVVYKNYPMFGTRFRIGFLLPIFVGLYVVLIFYQARLLGVGREVTGPLRPNRRLHRVEKRLTGKTTSHQAAMAEWTSVVAIDDAVWPNKSQSHISCPISFSTV
jgi:membrane protein implicated in regulation of membrane protease activity